MKTIVAILVACAGAVASSTGQAPAADARFEALASLTEAKMREYGVPGVAVGIVNGGTVTIRGFGVTSVEFPQPIGEHTVFPIASISKTFAATVAMRLVEQGKLDLKAPVRKYIPEFRVQDEAASRDATIWNLLTHTPGWEGQVSGPDRGGETVSHFLTTITDLMQLAPPGVAWSYNNAGFSILGRVFEVVAGQPLNRVMREHAFTPIGLQHTGTTAGEFITWPFALGHSVRSGQAPTLNRPFSPSITATTGAVGLCITDMMTYARFHMGDGTSASGDRVLTRQSVEQMRKPQLKKQGYDDEMGLGWHLRTVGNVRVAGHGGTLGGHILLLEIAPERNFAIGILTNSNTGWRLIQDVERAALQSYLAATFARNQAISHRGLVETLPSAEPLASQPDFAAYLGNYRRPMNTVAVRSEGGRLIVQVTPRSGEPQAAMPVSFYGPDRAVVTDGNDKGQSIEFLRDGSGAVKWVRVTGRIALREQ